MSQGESATPLGKVKGLGSAQHGGGHWLEERFTSVALVLLSLRSRNGSARRGARFRWRC
jgi:succinate dehydrogenase / fumarate reductase membrane anchor subunit